ncbi:MAG: hypothetical protein ACKO5E_16970 [bacterium]
MNHPILRFFRLFPLLLLPLLVSGCGVEQPKKKASKQPSGVITRPTASAASSSGSTTLEINQGQTTGDSTDPQIVQQAAILDSVLHLLATAGTNPGGDNFTIATEQLNQYFNRNATAADFNLNQQSLGYLTELGLPDTAIRGLQEPKFSIRDARHIEDCMMYYGLANRIAGDGDNLTRLRRIFDWVTSHVMLVPANSLAPPGKNLQAQSRPYDCILRAMATEVNPQWAERSWIFMSLARQIGIDVGLLVSSRSAEQYLTIGLVDGKAYLFDCRVGLPLLSADGSTIATLDEALRDPRILAAMQLPGAQTYGPTSADLATGELVVLADLGTGYITPRMRLLQQRLSGKNRMILFRDIAELRAAFLQALKPRIKDVRMWELPLTVETLLFTNPDFVQAAQYSIQIFDYKLPLLAARTDQLRGESASAIEKFVTMRFAENAMLRDRVTPIPPEVQKVIDFYSTYFLALCYLDNASRRTDREADLKADDLRQARFFFNETLRLTPEPSPERPFFFMYRWGATTNLGLMAQQAGDVDTAIKFLGSNNPTGQGYGNLLTATGDIWANPLAALPPAPPAAPPDTFTPALPKPTAAAPPQGQPVPSQGQPAPGNSPRQPLPGLGGSPLQIPSGGIGGLPTGGPRPIAPGGASSIIPPAGGQPR